MRDAVVEEEFCTVIPLIKKKSIEKMASILEYRNYQVWRGENDILAQKDFGESYILINANLSEPCTLTAYSRFMDFFTSIPFRDYSIDELVRTIRKSAKYQIWRYACLDRDFGKCQNEKCRIDTRQSYFLAGKLLDVHHIKSLRKIIQENNLKSLDDAEKCAALWEIDNGLTLCDFCHRTVTKFERLLAILEEKANRYKNQDDINAVNDLRKLCVDKISLQRNFKKIYEKQISTHMFGRPCLLTMCLR
jgi:hypothetical protein